MNRETSKKLEYEFGRAFFDTLKEGEVDLLLHDDNPDFFTTKQMHTGFELTQIYSCTSNGDSRVYVEGSWDNLLDRLKEIWDARSLPFCHISLSFREPIPIPNKYIEERAKDIVNLIYDFIPSPKSVFRSANSMLINIPNLTGFFIERLINYESSLWSYYDASWTSSLKPDTIQKTINKKEQKRVAYLKRCNEIWLVIALYRGRASGNILITESTISHNYECNFNRLFLFECIPKKIYELNFKNTPQLS